MGIKVYNPTTPARRRMSTVDFSELSKVNPRKKKLKSLHSKAGRNNQGKITVHQRGGGAKRHYRLVDFKRELLNVTAKVISLEYDPNRSAFIALIRYNNGGREDYVLAPKDLKVGDKIITAVRGDISIGNRFHLKNIPIGTSVYNIELIKNKGGQIVRSAGSSATVLAKENEDVHIKLPSGEIRLINKNCFATIGQISNIDHENVRLGKAGRVRHMRRRPKVRGKAKNPCDHPHGGGEGGSPIGLKHPKTPTGKPALGYRTRKKKKFSNRYIIRRRTGEKVG